MTDWTPPTNPSLSFADMDTLMDGFADPAHRDEATAYLDQIDDTALLYTLAAAWSRRRGDRHDKPVTGMTADGFRTWIRNRI